MSFFNERPAPSRTSASSNGEASLTTVLPTQASKTELALLLALCTDSMRRSLLSTFDPDLTNVSIPSAVVQGRIHPIENSLVDFNDPNEQKDMLLEEARHKRVTECSSPEIQALRRAAATYFDKWQVEVLRRAGEVLNVRSEAIKKARAQARQKADIAAKVKQEKDFLTWAHGDEPSPIDNVGSDADSKGGEHFPGVETELASLEEYKKVVILDSMLLLLLSLEHYTAHSRTLMLHLTHSLHLPTSTLSEHESRVAQTLLATAASQMSGDASTKKHAADNAAARRWKVGLATVAGAALIGVTGGLAAPFLAAGAGAIMGTLGLGAIATLLGPLATNMILIGGLFGAYGGRMTGRIMEKYAREVEDFKFIPIRDPHAADKASSTSDDAPIVDKAQQEHRKLRVAIAISGWLSSPEDVVAPWRVISDHAIEPFALRFELAALLHLGRSLSQVLRSYAWDFAKFRLLGLLFVGLWPLGLIRAARVLDNPFIVAKGRSEKAGEVLAHALMSKVQGERPVTLIGYSLGARVIYTCLLELANQNAFGLVESVVLMGTPAPSDSASWRRVRSVVAGRLVNIYSEDDFTLGFMYRASSAQFGVAGLQAIEGITSVENFNVTQLVKGHTKYRFLVGSLLRKVGFEDIDEREVGREIAVLKQIERKEMDEKSNVETASDADELKPVDMVDREKASDDLLGLQDAGAEARPPPPPMRQQTIADEKPPPYPGRPLGRKPVPQAAATTPAQVDLLGVDSPEEMGSKIAGLSTKVEPQPASSADTRHMDDDDESGDENHGRIQLVDLDPVPEPDFGDDHEVMKFGEGDRGFNLTWNNK